MTANEEYLLGLIVRLRGNAYDSATRLSMLADGAESVQVAASREEVDELLEQLASNRFGAHLPGASPYFLKHIAKKKEVHGMITRHRLASKTGTEITNVQDLIKKESKR